MLQASVRLAEEFESLNSFLLSNSNCLYLAVSVLHSAEDLDLRGLIDSVIQALLSLFSLDHPTKANTHLMDKHCSFLLLYDVPSCKNDGTSPRSNTVASGIALGSVSTSQSYVSSL